MNPPRMILGTLLTSVCLALAVAGIAFGAWWLIMIAAFVATLGSFL